MAAKKKAESTPADYETITPSEELIEVEIDGLLTMVSKQNWEDDQASVIGLVRENRAMAVGNKEGVESAKDYAEMIAEYGEDGEPEDD